MDFYMEKLISALSPREIKKERAFSYNIQQ